MPWFYCYIFSAAYLGALCYGIPHILWPHSEKATRCCRLVGVAFNLVGFMESVLLKGSEDARAQLLLLGFLAVSSGFAVGEVLRRLTRLPRQPDPRLIILP